MPAVPHIMDYTGNGWIGVVAMFIFLGFFLALGISGKHYIQKMSEANAPRRRTVNYREEQQDAKAAIILSLASVLSIALCAYILLLRFNVIQQNGVSVLIVLGVVTVYVVLKYIFMLLVNYIFGFKFTEFGIWFQFIFYFIGLCSVIIAVYASHFPYLTTVVISLGSVFVISLIAEFLVLVKNFSAKITSVFYIFLYLCTSEILPLAVGFRIISNVLN